MHASLLVLHQCYEHDVFSRGYMQWCPHQTRMWLWQDTDTSVREATANAFGLIAANLAAEKSTFCTGDTSSNPVLRAIFESLGAQQKEVNLAASQALAKANPCFPIFAAGYCPMSASFAAMSESLPAMLLGCVDGMYPIPPRTLEVILHVICSYLRIVS